MYALQNLILLCFIALCATEASAKGKTIIQGTTSDVKEGFIMIRNLTKPVADTLTIKDGQFSYSTEIEESLPFILVDEANRYQLFFAEPGKTIKITLLKKDMIVTFLEGSAAHDKFRELIQSQEPLQQFAQQVQKAHTALSANTDSLNQVMDNINTQLRNNFFGFIQRHHTSEVAAFVIYSAINNDRNVNVQTVDTMYKMLQGAALKGFYGKELSKMVSKLRSIEVGYMAPDFTLPDSTGKKNYSLSSLRGKYVLIDFWASWCGPCKAEIPFLKKAYENYKAKGFEIISVSLDDKRPNWISALNQYAMPWIHVSDVKGFNSIVNDLYHVPSIPKTLLLDKTGKIIATDLRGAFLEQKLAEILGGSNFAK